MKEKLLIFVFILSIIVMAGCTLTNLFGLSFSLDADPTATDSPDKSIMSATITPTYLKITSTGNPKDPTKTPTKTPMLPTKTVTLEPTLTLGPSPSPNLSIEAPPTELRIQGADSIFGIHVDDWSSASEKTVLMDSGGVWSRFDGFRWDLLEPVRTDPPTYKWQALNEDGLENITSDNTLVIGIALLSPEWAQKYPGIACGPFAENALDRFGSFMQEIVFWYSQPPFNVKYWELGNEPDIYSAYVLPDSGYGCWGEPDDEYFGGRYYADMLKIAYPRIKEADPESQVLIGGLMLDCDPDDPPENQNGELRDCTSSKFLEGILENGGGDYFDGVSFHAYDYYYGSLGYYGNSNWHSSWNSTGPVLSAKTKYLRDLLERYGYADKQLLNTEVALICGSTGNEDFCKTQEFEKTKANYVVQAYSTAIANNLQANVWYSLNGWRRSGLVQRNELTPYPAYTAFQFATEQFKDVRYLGMVDMYPGIQGYRFEREDTRFWVLWALDDDTHEITLPHIPDAVFDSLGNVIPLDVDLTVTLEPRYVVWNK